MAKQQSNTQGYQCAPAHTGSGGTSHVKKSPGVLAREEARKNFIKPAPDALERYRQESRIGELLAYAIGPDEDF